MSAANKRSTIERSLRKSRGGLLVLGLAVCIALLGWQSHAYWRNLQDNGYIGDLEGGIDRETGGHSSPNALLARGNFLLKKSRFDEAQLLSERSILSDAPDIQAAIYYNIANARLRAAHALIERQQTERAISLVSLANEEYRQALRLRPNDWNIRYNFDSAMRLVRSAPRIQMQQEGEMERRPERKQSWTDLPSLPKGLP